MPSNVIRFEQQRMTGRAERVDLYLTWPGMQGYTDETRALFNDVNHPESLIFLEISQSTMSRDMSGRMEPIYQHLFDGAVLPGPAGLVRHEMKENSGYGQEVFFTANRDGDTPYAVRCILPATPAPVDQRRLPARYPHAATILLCFTAFPANCCHNGKPSTQPSSTT